MVRVIRYRITVEPIDEPEKIAARLQTLWEAGESLHDQGPLQDEAKRLGVELQGRFGAKRK